MRPAAAAVLLAAALGATGCGMKGDPLPPLRKTPPPVSDLAVSQRGDRIVLELTVPQRSVDGLALRDLRLDILTARTDGEFRKVARRRAIRVAPGERVEETEPLPMVGYPFRVAVVFRTGEPDRGGPPPAVIIPVEPPVPPSNLRAQAVADGIRLRWAGEIPPPPPSPAGGTAPQGAAAAPGAGPASGLAPLASSRTPQSGPPPEQVAAAPPPNLSTSLELASAAVAAPATASPVAAIPATSAPGAPVAAPPAPVPPGYRVYRRAPNGRYSALFEKPQTDRSFTDSGAGSGTDWCYVVRAVAALAPVRESASSNEVCLAPKTLEEP